MTPGSHLGSHEVTAQIGAGGMGGGPGWGGSLVAPDEQAASPSLIVVETWTEETAGSSTTCPNVCAVLRYTRTTSMFGSKNQYSSTPIFS